MANDKTRMKRRIQRQKNKLKKEHLLEILEETIPDDNEEGEDVPVEEDEGEPEPVLSKEMDMPFYAPTTFEEAEAMEKAREKAHEVHKVTYTVQDLVSNILHNPNLDPKEKGIAISKLGDGFGKRVQAIMADEIKKEKVIDTQILEIDALIARDQRNISIAEKAGDWIAKSFSNTDSLEDSKFALLVKEGETVIERKFPMATKSQVRASLVEASRIAKESDELPKEYSEQVFPALKKSAKEFGIGLQESKNSVIVEKDLSGNYRAILLPTNNFQDTDGEILSDSAHREYVEWVNKNMDVAPIFITKHLAGTHRESKIDFVGYQNGFVVMSVPLTEKEARHILQTQIHTDIGMSHGSIAFRNPQDESIIEKYRVVEVSDLPLTRAANPFTTLDVIAKEAHMNTQEYLASMLGPDEAKKYIEKMGLKQEELRALGIKEKEASTSTPSTESTPTATAPASDAKPSDMTMEQLVAVVAKEFGMEELSKEFSLIKEKADSVDEMKGKLVVLETLVKELKKSDDEKIAQKISPPVGTTLSWLQNRPSQSPTTVLNKENELDSKLEKSVPQAGWLSEATQTTPVAGY